MKRYTTKNTTTADIMQTDIETWIIDSIKNNTAESDALIDDLWFFQKVRWENSHRRHGRQHHRNTGGKDTQHANV